MLQLHTTAKNRSTSMYSVAHIPVGKHIGTEDIVKDRKDVAFQQFLPHLSNLPGLLNTTVSWTDHD